jgi:hypothetical protein
MPAIRVLFSLTLLRSEMDVLAASFVLLMDARILAAPEPRARGGDRDVLVVGEPTADLPITDSAAMVSRAPVRQQPRVGTDAKVRGSNTNRSNKTKRSKRPL